MSQPDQLHKLIKALADGEGGENMNEKLNEILAKYVDDTDIASLHALANDITDYIGKNYVPKAAEQIGKLELPDLPYFQIKAFNLSAIDTQEWLSHIYDTASLPLQLTKLEKEQE